VLVAGPEYERPAAPVPPTYPADVTPASAPGAEAAADIDWQRFFADPRLKRLIELALANNRDLRIAVLNIEQARAIHQIRRADELPSVGIGGSASRAAVGDGVATVYAVGFAVAGYELDLFGRVHNLSDAALSQYFATAETRKAVQISLVSSVANAYLALLADEEQLRVTRETLATREESTRITKLRFDNGATSELDYRQAESQLEGAKAALAQSLRQRALDENALQLLVGQPLPADLPPPLPLGAEQIPVDVPPGLPSDLLERRPDIRAAERQLLAANANIGAAKAAFFPRITLTANLGTASGDLSGCSRAARSRSPERRSCCSRSSTPAATRPTSTRRASTTASPSPSTSARSRARSARSPTRSPAGRRSASRCAPGGADQRAGDHLSPRRPALPRRRRRLPRGARGPALALRVAAVAGADAGAAAAEHGGPVPRPRRRLARSVRGPGAVEPGDSAAALTARRAG
jgi:hypothetical protein